MSFNTDPLRDFMESVPASLANPDSMMSLDLRALEALTGNDKAQAQDVLQRLLAAGDVRAVYAVERLEIQELYRVLEQLSDALMQGDLAFPEVGVAAMVALERLGESGKQNDFTTKHLDHLDKNAKLRVADIRAESEEGWQEVLLRLLEDDDSDVRLRAAKSLAARAGLLKGLEDIGAKAWIQRMWLCIPLPSLQRQILGELPSLAQEIAEGMHPKPSSRSVDLHDFLVSLACPIGVDPWADGFNLEALLRLRDVERDYMAMSLVSKLFLGERRAPAALMALGDVRSVSALKEFSRIADGSMELAVRMALNGFDV